MNIFVFLVGVLLCLAVVNGRSFEERRDTDPLAAAEDEGHKKHGSAEMRHRRRRWQMNYGYDLPTPPYYPDRRDYDRNQQDLLLRIVKLLEEISVYVKRPQPPPLPPQPIYISYPVPIPVPQYTPCTPVDNKKVNITSRFPEMEDTNQNWGFVVNEEDNNQIGDGSRPISFEPIRPKQPLKRPVPKVEHGTVQEDGSHTTQASKLEDNAAGRVPVVCNAAILSCCADDPQLRHQCFKNFNCGATYDNGKACSEVSLAEALETFKMTYAPIQ